MATTLHNLLISRIATANRYVLNIFTTEYNVLEHIYNLQKVFFLGAGDLMQTFYSNLFQSVSQDGVDKHFLIGFIESNLFHFTDEQQRELEQFVFVDGEVR